MKIKRAFIVGIILLTVSGVVIYKSFDRIALFALSRFYGIDVSYKGSSRDAKDGFIFENLKIINKKMGMGFFSSRAALKPQLGRDLLKSVNIDFKFKDVHFIKSMEDKVRPKYDTLSEVVAMPFEGRWMYKDIAGEVELFSNGLTFKKFMANGREIRLVLSGDLFYNNTAQAEISIYFSKDVLKDIPPELPSVIMQDEPGEWKSFSVKLKGDLSSPSIQVSGKLFRLNIGTVVIN